MLPLPQAYKRTAATEYHNGLKGSSRTNFGRCHYFSSQGSYG